MSTIGCPLPFSSGSGKTKFKRVNFVSAKSGASSSRKHSSASESSGSGSVSLTEADLSAKIGAIHVDDENVMPLDSTSQSGDRQTFDLEVQSPSTDSSVYDAKQTEDLSTSITDFSDPDETQILSANKTNQEQENNPELNITVTESQSPEKSTFYDFTDQDVSRIVPLNDGKKTLSSSATIDSEEERAYTDDDIDDFGEDESSVIPGSLNLSNNNNNNNLCPEESQSSVVVVVARFDSDMASSLLSEGAVLWHDECGETDAVNSGAIFSKGAMKPGPDDFVQAPLPPPPPSDFLNNQTQQNLSPNNAVNGIKSYQKVKPAVWSPTSKSPDEFPLPPPPSADELASTTPGQHFNFNSKPKGFRAVTVPNARETPTSPRSDSRSSNNSGKYPGYPNPSNGDGRLTPSNDALQRRSPNGKDHGGYVTLLRDTRQILIKPSNSSQAKVESSSTFSVAGKPFPTSQNAKTGITPNEKLPEGAVYQTTTQEGELVHTDTYYPAADNGNHQSVVLERTKKTTLFKAPHHTGIGPVNDNGVPFALRSTVDDSKHWYKNMFKQMHKIETGEGNDERPASAIDQVSVNDRTVQHHSSVDIEKPTKVGRITDYQPAAPYVVENEPVKLNLDTLGKPRRRRGRLYPNIGRSEKHLQTYGVRRSSSLEDFSNMQWGDFFDDVLKPKTTGQIWDLDVKEQMKNSVPPASPSYKPPPSRSQVTVDTSPAAASATSYTAYRNAMSAPTKTSPPQVKPKTQSKDESKLRQPARAKFDFSAQTAKELSAKKGQTLIVTRRVNEDWYQAETVDGKQTGIIPVQYLDIISPSSSPEKPSRNGQAKAKFDFNGSSKVELSFKKGDDILLLKKVDANWYKGKVGGSTGILPAVYVDVLVEPESAEVKVKSKVPKELEVTPKSSPRSASSASSGQSSARHSYSLSQASSEDPDETERKNRAAFLAHTVVGSSVQLHPKKQQIGEFDMTELDRVVESFSEPQPATTPSVTSPDGGGYLPPPPAHLTPSVPSYPSSNISSQPSTPRVSTPPPPAADFGQVLARYVALYPYEANNEDELELVAGDAIVVVETCDDGWYVGTCERTGAFGTFPGNYATLANS